MKCKNCGAELNNGRCEYCGSVFPEEVRLLTLKPQKIDEKVIRKVLSRVEVTCLGDTEPHFIEGIKYV